ncbi:MAG TPA: hypothetical protein VHS78_15315 [Candidatus Elarobacter sp.]|jgi:hypothetical protein|nr:hypothetical protein [Candidatus Elarobacter sp.]
MRVLVGALLAALATGPVRSATGDLAVTLDAHRVAGSCAVVSSATVVAYDARAPRVVTYRFVRSDGSVSRTGLLAFSGEGAVAQSVSDAWTPRGAAPWVALEIVSPERMRSPRVRVTAPCARGVVAATR